MDISRIILGPIVTEKAERMKTSRNYTLKVWNNATKIDVKAALKKFYNVDVASIRVMRTTTKSRALGAGRVMVKRSPSKRMMVTLTEKSPALDFSKFKAS
ncbi:50S ribosomal protein L23 [Candidatus Peribacteria bacterium]|nr:MAG: 50S ribosomal protein L23 [Candidatus Peribacteria bacterium]